MNYSRKQLEAMGEPLGESVTRLKPGGRIYGGGGGNQPTTTTVNQSNIPEWLRPQVEQVLGGATKELFNTEQKIDPATGKGAVDANGKPIYDITGAKPFVPYSTNPQDYVAGFSPLQQQVQYNAANLQVPGQFNQATGYANAAGQGGLNSAAQAAGYGNAGFQSGQMGQMMGQQAAGQAAYNANKAQNQAYGYGNMGVQAGLQGQQSGFLGQQAGMQGGQYYGGAGAGYGQQAANLAPNAGYYGNMGAGYGASAANLAPQAQQYGSQAADIGNMALQAQATGQDITGQSRGYADRQAAAGQDYARQMTNPSAVQQYMNPYQSAVTDVQVAAAQRQADIAAQGRKAAAARAGAFGGARQAIENAEANRALATQQDTIRAQGQQAAYDKAIQAMQYGSNLGLQGLCGAQAGLGTALQGGQLGLSGIGQAMAGQQAGMAGLGQAGSLYGLGMQGTQSGLAGLNAANQAYQTGIQGAGMGLQGVDRQMAGTAQGMQGAQSAMQGAGVGLSGVGQAINAGQYALQGADRGLAGTAQGMQGAQTGLQGVSGQQAGYGLANQAAGQLGQLGTQQLAAQQGILGLQNQLGGQQQAQEQQYINQAIQNYAQGKEMPMQSLNQFNALLRGYALPGTTTTQYQAQPTLGNQLAGFGTAGIGAAQLSNVLGKKKGGTVRSSIADLGLYNAMH